MDELERGLRLLGQELVWPVSADLTGRVNYRLDQRRAGPRRIYRPVILLIGVAVLVAIVSLSPGARQAIARLLGVAGVKIEMRVETTLPPTGNVDLGNLDLGNLDLGVEVEATAVGDLVDFLVLTGAPADLGAPDAIYFDERRLGGQVTILWGPQPDLPRTSPSGVGMLISSFQGRLDRGTYSKELDPSQHRLLDVEVRGVAGFWIEGEPHVFLYEDADGVIQFETIRLAGNVLLWEENGVTIRIESALPLEEVLRIAGSLTPLT